MQKCTGLFCVQIVVSYLYKHLPGTFVAVMGIEKTYDIRWLRSRPTSGGYTAEKVDTQLGIIYDVVMVQEGEAKGHRVNLDEDFIRDIVAYDNRVFGDRGVKVRFGHPKASSDTMGTQMGVFKNIRERKHEGKWQAIGNLHLLDAADDSPTHPGMRTWMLKMAVQQPDFVMMSIVFAPGAYFQRNKNGGKNYIKGEREVDPDLGEVFVEFGAKGEHHYTDAVEQGAATDKLFSNQINPHLFVAQADEFLSEHPQITEFIKAHPEKVTAFFASMGINITQSSGKKMDKFNLFKWLSGESQTPAEGEDLESVRTALTEVQTEVTALKAEKITAENRVQELASEVEGLNTSLRAANEELKAVNTQLAELQKENEELKAAPADTHTGGATEALASEKSKTPVWDKVKTQFGIE